MLKLSSSGTAVQPLLQLLRECGVQLKDGECIAHEVKAAKLQAHVRSYR